MRKKGTLTSWNPSRGFGFITPTDGGPLVFVHIKDLPLRPHRWTTGHLLTYVTVPGERGKPRAAEVECPAWQDKPRPQPEARPAPRQAKPERVTAPAAWSWPRRLVVPLFAALWVYTAQRWGVSPWAWAVYGLMSMLAYVAYTRDKWAAEDGRWRTPEDVLHLLDLLGGWPGALLAQQVMRHKTTKGSFVATFWMTVLFNMGGFVLWHAKLLPMLQGSFA